MESPLNKESVRCLLEDLRASLSQARRVEAAEALVTRLLPLLAPYTHILSFVSFGHEIDTTPLNERLSEERRLHLPKMVGENLEIFHVTDLKTQLTPTRFGLFEPDLSLCDQVESSLIQCVLVPALGFDARNHRIGYGKGFYDRFLQQIPHVQTVGIGFTEQYLPSLPVEPTDISLQKVSLF